MLKTSIDDFAKIRRLSNLTASPDGSRAAVTVNTVNLEKNKYENNIWLDNGRQHGTPGHTQT